MVKRMGAFVAAAVLAGWAVSELAAQSLPERTADKRRIAADVRQTTDDRRDVDRLSDLVIRWDRLRQTEPNSASLKQVEDQIFSELRRDLKETATQTGQAKTEVKQSTAEARQSKGELKREKRDRDRDKRELRDDRRDLADDRRDMRDDERDAKKIEDLLNRKRSVAKDLVTLQREIDAPGKAGDNALQQRQKALLEEYLKLSQEEIRLGIREGAEDKRELREDRRESREDRRP
ncbi:MAG TPA: hypothetical protein VGB38_07990 [bacterium]